MKTLKTVEIKSVSGGDVRGKGGEIQIHSSKGPRSGYAGSDGKSGSVGYSHKF